MSLPRAGPATFCRWLRLESTDGAQVRKRNMGSNGANSRGVSGVDIVVSRLHRLVPTFRSSNQTWCCDRCRDAALVQDRAVALKHAPPIGVPQTDLPELVSRHADPFPRFAGQS